MVKSKYLADLFDRALHDPAWWLGGGLFLFLGSLLLASSRTVSGTEAAVFRAIYNLPGFLTPIFFGLTLLGSAWAVVAVLIYLLWRQKRHLATVTGLTVGSAYILSIIVKTLVDRPRPTTVLPNIASRELFVNASLGFPSAHTAVSAAMALTLLTFLPKNRRWLVPLWIILVAVSRVYLGVHAPLDVVGGAGIGMACAGFVKLAPTVTKFSLKQRQKGA